MILLKTGGDVGWFAWQYQGSTNPVQNWLRDPSKSGGNGEEDLDISFGKEAKLQQALHDI